MIIFNCTCAYARGYTLVIIRQETHYKFNVIQEILGLYLHMMSTKKKNNNNNNNLVLKIKKLQPQ